MAELIIRGMEMPESCFDCPIFDNFCQERCGVTGTLVYGEIDPQRETLPDCPLIPLPEGHGRLIDAERFRVILCRLKERQNDDVAIHALNWAIECLDKLDTIVPVEGDGEDV